MNLLTSPSGWKKRRDNKRKRLKKWSASDEAREIRRRARDGDLTQVDEPIKKPNRRRKK